MWKLQGLGNKVGFGGLKGVFPSLPTSAVRSLGCKTRQKMKAGIRKIVKHTHTHNFQEGKGHGLVFGTENTSVSHECMVFCMYPKENPEMMAYCEVSSPLHF